MDLAIESAKRRNAFPAEVAGVGLAMALVVVAWAVTTLLQNRVSTAGFIFFYTAVVLSAWYGDRWGGLMAVILATLTVEYFFMPPLHSLRVDAQSLPVFIEFAASSAVVGWFSAWRKKTEIELRYARDELQFRVDERTAELQHSNEQLLSEMAERNRAEQAYYAAQAELERITRISAMGALAASISHEVNQPLAAVVTNADACLMWLSADQPNLEEARAAVDSIAREGTRASDVVRRIRAMFTKSAPEREPLEIDAILREAIALMEPQAARTGITIQVELAASDRKILADRVQLQQVVVNLILNAIEAMRDLAERPRRIVVRSEIQSEDDVLVAVRDYGIGIDPRNQRRLFDPFFTTKPQGMGVGLSISRTIVEAHGGRLWAIANSDWGATFQFTISAPAQNAV